MSETAESMRESSRYPYTYAADYLRVKVGRDSDKGLISRAAASRIRSLIADVLEVSSKSVAILLAEKYISEETK